MATWEKYNRPTEDGTIVEMQAPLIVSASRSTDIPAFYADWFFDRLQKGYSAWTNPFNGRKYYVSYENTRFIVFWSKNPRPLLKYLPILKERNIRCYVQFTLNDYERERLEKVPSLDNRIETFKLLHEQLGHGGVIWRFDPLILTDDISVDNLLSKIQNIGDQLKDFSEKLVFSFADIEGYKKVKSNLLNNGIPYHEWEYEEMNDFAERLVELNRERGWNYQLATCGENFDALGISRNRCIDGDLIVRRAWDDKKLMDFMRVKIEDVPAPSLFGLPELPQGAILLPKNHYFISKHRKDMGQRPFCECMASKDIGEYNTCPHLCEYCYANTTKELALANWKRHQENKFAETIMASDMSEFINRFKARGNITFLGMRDTAISMLPSDRMVLDKLYNDLKRGTGILDDEVHLNMYLKCFGKMHKAKLDSAFACIPAATDLFSNEIEIYDWGCGQGIATICLLDYLKANNINYDIKNIHLNILIGRFSAFSRLVQRICIRWQELRMGKFSN